MTNTKLLEYSSSMSQQNCLTELERQRLFCLKIALNPMPCVCGYLVNQIEASGKTLDEFPVDDHRGLEFRCPKCRLKLIESVPFMGPPYFWRPDQEEINKRLGVA